MSDTLTISRVVSRLALEFYNTGPDAVVMAEVLDAWLKLKARADKEAGFPNGDVEIMLVWRPAQ